MWGAVELSDIHDVVLIFEHCCFIVVDIKIVWRREDGHDTWESSSTGFSIHSVSSILCFMRSDYGQ